MVVKKYYGKTTREALQHVRNELGTDALILSNRPLQAGGVEIMAVADADVNQLASSMSAAAPIAPARKNPAPTAAAKPLAPNAIANALARTYALPVEPLVEPSPPRPIQHALTTPQITTPARPKSASRPALSEDLAPYFAPRATEPPLTPAARPRSIEKSKPIAQSIPDLGDVVLNNATETRLDRLNDEVRMLRGLLQGQLAGLAWSQMEQQHPQQAELFRHLLAAGLSPALGRQLVNKLPHQLDGERALTWSKAALAHNLHTVEEESDLIQRGGIYALVRPTGVGKTTTVAKLAARAMIKYGNDAIALITTDSYRIGAQDQLKLYGRILGVSVYAVDNEADLQLTLADLAHKHLVLIDSVGMGQRDARVHAQTAMYACGNAIGGRRIKRMLLLSANAAGHTLHDVITRYQGEGLSGCILTKIDEALTLGAGLDIIIRHRLPLYYVTNGQRVPEDLHVPEAHYLIERAFKAVQFGSPFALRDEEFRVMQAAQVNGV